MEYLSLMGLEDGIGCEEALMVGDNRGLMIYLRVYRRLFLQDKRRSNEFQMVIDVLYWNVWSCVVTVCGHRAEISAVDNTLAFEGYLTVPYSFKQ